MKCFLLRYEEQMLQSLNPIESDGDSSSDVLAGSDIKWTQGTKSVTNVKAESCDTDVNSSAFRAIPRSAAGAGTQTLTAVRAEAIDVDPRSRNYGIFGPVATPPPNASIITINAAPSLGTKTMTRIRAEEADQDPGHATLCVIPRCFSS